MEPELPEIGGRVVFNLLPRNRLQLAPANHDGWKTSRCPCVLVLVCFDLFSGANLLLVSGKKYVLFTNRYLDGGFGYLLFSSLPGEMIRFD